MGKMVYLMGKSSTGKDTVYSRLLQWPEGRLQRVVPYTTRPIRLGEEEGKEYHFTDDEGYEKLNAQGRVIESRAYQTYYGVWRYFTVDDGQIDLQRNCYLMIGTLESFLKMSAYYGREQMLPILLEVDDGVRLQRALDREKRQDHPGYEEMCRRYLADARDFSEEKIAEAGIEHRFCNTELTKCVEEIKEYILHNV